MDEDECIYLYRKVEEDGHNPIGIWLYSSTIMTVNDGCVYINFMKWKWKRNKSLICNWLGIVSFSCNNALHRSGWCAVCTWKCWKKYDYKNIPVCHRMGQLQKSLQYKSFPEKENSFVEIRALRKTYSIKSSICFSECEWIASIKLLLPLLLLLLLLCCWYFEIKISLKCNFRLELRILCFICM